LRNTLTILRIHLSEELYLFLLYLASGILQRSGDVGDKVLPVLFLHDLSEQRSGLLEVVIGMDVLVPTGETGDGLLTPSLGGILFHVVNGVRLIVSGSAVVTIDLHEAISLVVSDSGSVRTIYWDLIVVGSESVSVGVWVGEESSLEHLVVGGLDAGNQVGGRESGLLDFSEVVFGVPVER
jgi:hypothetical protein